jgi:hypothetical protein
MDAVVDIKKPGLDVIKGEKIPHILEAGELGAILELTVTDPKTGKVTEHRTMKSQSFVQQFLQLLMSQCASIPLVVGLANVRDTGNTLRTIFSNGAVFRCNAGAADVTLGIIVGTDNTAPTISDYKIGTIIPHATLNYGAVTYGLPSADSITSQFTITRNFSNVTGGSVAVNELALYVQSYDTGSTIRNFMTIRDVIAGGISVPSGQTLTVNYRLQAVV